MSKLITVTGVVQGVGFRPYIYRQAMKLSLTGWVRNDGEGVTIYLTQDLTDNQVRTELLVDPPPGARIDAIACVATPVQPVTGFTVIPSDSSGPKRAEVPIDLAICTDCQMELFDAVDRRHGYPYINCTNCGPRFSVILALPYDRANTTMAPWPPCESCRAEYEDPLNRRFHAEPTACPTCGPNYYLVPKTASPLNAPTRGTAALELAAAHLRDGAILGIKGIGGYLLACDARNEGVVGQLRSRKFRKDKPFALMAKDLNTIMEVAGINTNEAALLQSSSAPIVLLEPRGELPLVAPNAPRLGIMLPYAPLHYLLFHYGAPELMVMTSGNRSSEPMVIEDTTASDLLLGIADEILVGERPIARRVDDSVVALDHRDRPVLIRRARGYAPTRVTQLAHHAGVIVGCGADLKSTITLSIDGQVTTSPYLGDLSYREIQQEHRHTLKTLLGLWELGTADLVLATDAHPDYHVNQLAHTYAAEFGIDPPQEIQHHRAHFASVLAEHRILDDLALGVTFDGTGYGDDGSTWGGEFFYGSLPGGFERIAHLEPSPLPGGDAAARYPLQCLVGFLEPDAWSQWIGPRLSTDADDRMRLSLRLATLKSTSVGRLFDAVAAILGFDDKITYEAQAAAWLEALATSAIRRGYRPQANSLLSFIDNAIYYRGFLAALAEQVYQRRQPPDEIAADFHASLASATATALYALAQGHPSRFICLSGGVFQNLVLRQALDRQLQTCLPDHRVLYNERLSCNDENISLGQVALVVMGLPTR